MLVLDAEQTTKALPWNKLIEALREGFVQGCQVPPRTLHDFDIPKEENGVLLLKPAWVTSKYLGVKQVLFIPSNGQRSMSMVNASYQLSSAQNGKALANIDGDVLTDRRTAASSALASSYLSRTYSRCLLMVGNGRLASSLVEAHSAVRPIDEVLIWGRNIEQSKALADKLNSKSINCKAVDNLEVGCGKADIISCATGSKSPLVKGNWLKQGTHVDLVGGFTPKMRESDDELMRVADKFVDTDDAIATAGDITQAIDSGAIDSKSIQANLYDLCRNAHRGRSNDKDITVFKSVGTALEDLYAAILAYESVD